MQLSITPICSSDGATHGREENIATNSMHYYLVSCVVIFFRTLLPDKLVRSFVVCYELINYVMNEGLANILIGVRLNRRIVSYLVTLIIFI